MPQTLEIPNANGNGDQIKVGTTGTVSSLMSRELETVKQSGSAAQASSSSRKKLQEPPVSVPCGYSPRRTQPRRSTTNDPSSSSNCSNSGSRSPADAQKTKPSPRRNEHRSPMLASAEPTLERNWRRRRRRRRRKDTLTLPKWWISSETIP